MQTNLTSWIAAFGLGALLSAGVLLNRPAPLTPDSAVQSLTPAMDRLNNYSCRWAETKHIVLGGREDGFSPDGEETATPGDLYDYMAPRTGSPVITATRDYDVAGNDNAFIERFTDFPDRIAHGLFVVRFKQLGTLRTDFMNVGDLLGMQARSHMHSTSLDPATMQPNWTYENSVMWTRLETAVFRTRMDMDGRVLPATYGSLLEMLRGGTEPLELVISDDTVVDMIGFALCSAPQTRMGTTFLAEQITPDIVDVRCVPSETSENHCNQLSGDTVCSAELPLSCFAETLTPAPTEMGLDASRLFSWSGGKIAFTPPRRGDSISTQAEGHAVCRAQFGAAYRMANVHDGVQAVAFMGHGRAPDTPQVWVDSNLEPYGNCWTRMPDYSADDRPKGRKDG